jgi:hypothetical protein
MFRLETVITYGMVPKEFVPEGKAVNSEFCVQVMERVLKQMFSEATISRDVLSHSSVKVQYFLANQGPVITHPLYSNDLC